MTTRGHSRLARRFETVLEAHNDQLPRVAERCHELEHALAGLEARVVALEEGRVFMSRPRVRRALAWVVWRFCGRQEDDQAG